MKTTLFATATAATFALGLTLSNAQTHHSYHQAAPTPCSKGHSYTAPVVYPTISPKEGLVKRLAIAPKGFFHYAKSMCSKSYNYSPPAPINGHTNALAQSTLHAPKVKMLGKVAYGSGKSWLDWNAKNEIKHAVLSHRGQFGPNTMVMILGFADRKGHYETNLHLSNERASQVNKHIQTLNWEYGLHLKTTTVAMGEEIELCSHNYGHNRVAEVWLVEFPQQATEVIEVVPATQTQIQTVQQPVVTQTIVPQPQIRQQIVAPTINTQSPVQQIVRTQAPATRPVITPQPITSETTTVTQTIANPLDGLAQFLQQNVTLNDPAKAAEFAQKLAELQALSATN